MRCLPERQLLGGGPRDLPDLYHISEIIPCLVSGLQGVGLPGSLEHAFRYIVVVEGIELSFP